MTTSKALEALRALQDIGALEPGLIGMGAEIEAAQKLARKTLAELEAEMAQAKPAGEAELMPGTQGFTMAVFAASDVPAGTKLYTSPQLQDSAEALFLLHSGLIDDGGEQGEWEPEAWSQKRVDDFCRLHPGQTIELYPKVKK